MANWWSPASTVQLKSSVLISSSGAPTNLVMKEARGAETSARGGLCGIIDGILVPEPLRPPLQRLGRWIIGRPGCHGTRGSVLDGMWEPGV